MGGQTRNEKIYEALCEKLDFDTRTWQKYPYDGFDSPFITDSAPSTSLNALQNKKGLYLFGGSNTNDICNYIQPVEINNDMR